MNVHAVLEFKVHRLLPMVWFVLGILNLGLGIWSGGFFRFVFAALCGGLGTLMWTRPLVMLTTDSLEMLSLLGSRGRVVSYEPHQISIRGKSIFIGEKKVLSTWWTDCDIQEVRSFLAVHLGTPP